jgi:hypothetical protein
VSTDYKVAVPEGVSGDVRIERFEIPRHSIENVRMAFDGRGATPGTYTRLMVGRHLWMSDTNAEWRDHLEAVHQIRARGGRVLINGLGLGMVVKAALAVDTVTRVDVVENSEDVIKLVGPTYEADPRVKIFHGDAFEMSKVWIKNSHWTVAWHDIWRNMSEDNLPEMASLKRSYGRRVDWQGAWGQDTILWRRRAAASRYW